MKSRVLIFTSSLSKGGAERNASILSQFLDAEVFLAVYKNTPITYPYGGTLIKLNITKTSGYFSKLFFFIKRILYLKKMKRDLKIDVSISLLDQPNLMNILSKNNEKTIISVRNFMSIKDREITGIIPIIKNILLRFLYNQADAVVAISQAMAIDLSQNYKVNKKRLRVIHNGCDIPAIQLSAEEKLVPPLNEIFNQPTLITAGKLLHQKGQWHLIRSFAQVKQVKPEIRLVILGHGNLQPYLMHLIQELGLNYSTSETLINGHNVNKCDIVFLGFQTNPFKFFSRATIFALPSLYEGFPNVLIEAMACGLPILATDCLSGPREILSPRSQLDSKLVYPYEAEFGILLPIPSGQHYTAQDKLSVEEICWTDVVTNLLNNNEKRTYFCKQSIQRVMDFNIKHTIKKWQTLIEKNI